MLALMGFMRGWGVLYLTFLGGCGQDLVSHEGDPGVITPSGDEHPDVERSTNGAAYRMLIDPQKGTFDLIPLAPPEYVSVFYTNFAMAPSGTGSNTVRIALDQTMSTYTNSAGVCYSGGVVGGAGCAAVPVGSPCRNLRTACAIVRAVNNFSEPLPDVIVQLANRATDTRNSIVSCADNGISQCAANPNNARKVDSSTSALRSAVGTGATGCSFCYNNASDATVVANPGLRDALLPGAEPTGMSTDIFQFVLTNDNAFGVDVITNYARPFAQPQVTLDDLGSTPSCASTGVTLVTASGGGFGPPSGCTAASCPASGTNATGYTVDFVRNDGSVTAVPQPGSVVWSDNAVSAAVSSATMAAGRWGMRIRTPFNTTGVQTAGGAFALCNAVLALDHFGVAVQGNPRAGDDINFGVVAFDVNNARIKSYAGTITMSLVPEGTFNGGNTYTFIPQGMPNPDNGGHKFRNGAHVNVSGSHTLSVTDGMGHTGSTTFMVR